MGLPPTPCGLDRLQRTSAARCALVMRLASVPTSVMKSNAKTFYVSGFYVTNCLLNPPAFALVFFCGRLFLKLMLADRN